MAYFVIRYWDAIPDGSPRGIRVYHYVKQEFPLITTDNIKEAQLFDQDEMERVFFELAGTNPPRPWQSFRRYLIPHATKPGVYEDCGYLLSEEDRKD